MYHDPLMIGPPRRGGMGAMPGYGGPGMGMPGMGVGGGDLEPPGMGPGLGGPFEPGLGGGGMQVGPDHPMFAGEPGRLAVLAVLCAVLCAVSTCGRAC
jgi:hypothetical protein